jgi:hypothetical protein
MRDNPIALDDYGRAQSELRPIAAQLVSPQGQLIRERFFFKKAAPYPAYYGPRAPVVTNG